jgi:hypothetical protein
MAADSTRMRLSVKVVNLATSVAAAGLVPPACRAEL